ncbi:hypothetical protein IE077_002558 [Cardiosporidium cionae]|uniref:Phosphoglycerate mutase n=1 Tax=Cardiosporidium cionae TaxID=476202 RepID=A0ABQ7JAJ8_9APIC|nr:hypothetical protein IE077_002558 [Cardiosporidium cionae]|eukprot:KAF8821023.1 hypothetical protein IE077_002558 [Cardiosporidium cionae]
MAPRNFIASALAANDVCTEVYLVRHGEVESQHWDTLYGRMDVLLSERGKQQAEKVGVFLKPKEIDVVISSPLKRAVYGAKQVAKHYGLDVLIDDAFIELDRGEWSGFSLEKVRLEYPKLADRVEEDPTFNEHNGECFEMVGEVGQDEFAFVSRRVVDALKGYIERFKGKRICVVSHYYVTKALLLVAQGIPLCRMASIDIPLGSISGLTFASNTKKSSENQFPSNLCFPFESLVNYAGKCPV